MTLKIDYSNMIARSPAVSDGPEGVAVEELEAAAARFARAHQEMVRQRAGGVLGFYSLPGDEELHAQSTRYAESVAGRFHDVVLLGIGGSALGPAALRAALRPPHWNLAPDSERGGLPRLHVIDNVDPATLHAVLARVEAARTLFVVTSKSGGTAETMAQYLIARDFLHERVGAAAVSSHMVFVTDPEKGALRAIAREEGVQALDIPPAVGGRFSVLSPVGLLPAALIGIDTAALLQGAGEMVERCETERLADNPAGVFATLQWLAHTRLGCGIHVLMPYSDALREFAAWFVQLWAESLGKVGLDGRPTGPTPLPAVGATDQHSQVQLFMEGPPDKTVTFIASSEHGTDIAIPSLHDDVPELSYLGGYRLGELLDVERKATAGALARQGRPNMTILVDRLDAWHVGSLIMLLEIATVYAAQLYGVNPLDQPGVELGKRFTYGMLGRADAESARREWNMLPEPDPRWTV